MHVLGIQTHISPSNLCPISGIPFLLSVKFMPLLVEICDRQSEHTLPKQKIEKVIRAICEDYGIASGEINVAFVDDQEMHKLNREYLSHDYTTDVLSFPLDDSDDFFVGQIIVCPAYASREAIEYEWDFESELLLYVTHGMLHLVGFDDHDEENFAKMRQEEASYLGQLGIDNAEVLKRKSAYLE